MRLALFFTRSGSLRDWIERGLFDREKLIYERHLSEGTLKSIVWLTYGKDDGVLAEKMKKTGRLDPRIEVRGRPRWFPDGRLGGVVYSVVMPLLHFSALRRVDLLKTNQLDGGWAAVMARFLLRKPLLLRCGYVQSKLETTLRRLPPWRLHLMLALERFQYRHCDLAVVASEHNARYIASNFAVPNSKIRILPNYIDEVLFSPAKGADLQNRRERVLFVGRFSPEKNLEALIRAANSLHLPLDLIGSGPQDAALGALISELGADAHLLGTVPNSELPRLINAYRYFALPSYFEGMPKALLEAMACGVVCIGSDVDGINEVIRDGVDGFLSKRTDPAALCEAIERARAADVGMVSVAARTKIIARYTLAAVAVYEKELFIEAHKLRG